MTRVLLSLVIGAIALWLSILVFGWIVSGDIRFWGIRANREQNAGRFWMVLTGLALADLAIFGLSLAVFAEVL